MARPKLSLKASNRLAPVEEIHRAMVEAVLPEIEAELLPAMPDIPPGWNKGALLNVRGTGDGYCVTLHPDEDDWRHPERSMKFTNTAMCQDFVSRWYSRENSDPRAR